MMEDQATSTQTVMQQLEGKFCNLWLSLTCNKEKNDC